MFNSDKWTKLTEKTYGYGSRKHRFQDFILHYTEVSNSRGNYFVSPAFGDFIDLNFEALSQLESLISFLPNSAIRLKVCTSDIPIIKNFSTIEAGFVHETEFSSYDEWFDSEKLKYRFKRYLNPKYSEGLSFRVDYSKETLDDFFEIHTKLRINKFREIPQPKDFFDNIYNIFFQKKEGFIVGAFKENKLIAGILAIIFEGKCYYKFNASRLDMLHHYPNNHLVDFLIRYLSDIGIKVLNLGFTGSSEKYDGLRKYKISMGAREIPRYFLETEEYQNLSEELFNKINSNVHNLIKSDRSLEEINNFSKKNYKYFV